MILLAATFTPGTKILNFLFLMAMVPGIDGLHSFQMMDFITRYDTHTHHYFLLQQATAREGTATQKLHTKHYGLEVLAGIKSSKVLECHGHFRSTHCIDCKSSFDAEACKYQMINELVPPICPACGGYVKPLTVLFGEGLSEVFG